MPVQEKEAPGYFLIIKNPMDLSTIRKKISTKKYKVSEEMLKDIRLMANNCITYNGQEHPFSDIAQNIVKAAETSIAQVSFMIIVLTINNFC